MIMENDFRSANYCHFTMAKATFLSVPIFVAVGKGSSYTESLLRGYCNSQFYALKSLLYTIIN